MDEMKKMNGKYKDPVCGMSISLENVKVTTTYHGNEYHFCSEDCAKKFDKNPENYIKVEHEHMNMKMDTMGKREHKARHGCSDM